MNVRNLWLGLVAILATVSLLAQVGRTGEGEVRHESAGEKYGADNCRDNCQADNYCAENYCGDTCGAASCCSDACAVPCWQFYGDYLYLRPRNDNLEYAVPMNGPISPGQVPVQEGRTAAVNPQFESGFRVGLARAFDECSTIGVAYTRYENRTDDAIAIQQSPFVIRSMVMHPSSLDAAADWLAASARQDINFDIADAEYRRIFLCDDHYSLSYLLGARYVSLKQRFASQFESIVTENVNSDVNFDGAGIRLGLEGERFAPGRQLFLYGKASASFLGGEFRGSYFQGSTADPSLSTRRGKKPGLSPFSTANWASAGQAAMGTCGPRRVTCSAGG